jgi:hypothetical protein
MARVFCRSQIPGFLIIRVVPDFALLKIYEKLLYSFSSLFLLDQLQNLKCSKERKAYIFNEFNNQNILRTFVPLPVEFFPAADIFFKTRSPLIHLECMIRNPLSNL